MERGEVQRRNVAAPGTPRQTPNAERRTPNAKRRTPNAERRTPNAEREPGWHNPIFFAMIGDARAYLGPIVSTVRRTHCGFGQNRRLDHQLESRDRDSHYRHPNLHLGDRAWNWRN